MSDDMISREAALKALTEKHSRSIGAIGAIAALPAVTLGVRPLVWRDNYATTDMPLGYWFDGEDGDGWRVNVAWRVGSDELDDSFPTIDAAKAAAQADYAARILAAIEPQPAITVYECDGCGRMCRDPAADLKTLREAGKLSCCPERKMLSLSALTTTPAPDAAVAEAHDEQLSLWADELIADLVLNGLMDLVDHDYDTKVGARREVIAALKQANQAKVPQSHNGHPAPDAQAIREAALREAADLLFTLAGEKGGTKTPQGRTAQYYARRILALLPKGGA